MTGTSVRRVSRPRGELTAEQLRNLKRLQKRESDATADYHAAIAKAKDEGASWAMLAESLGHSTESLQRWVKAVRAQGSR